MIIFKLPFEIVLIIRSYKPLNYIIQISFNRRVLTESYGW